MDRAGILFAWVAIASSAADASPAVEWSTGLVRASGVGLADRQAPNPAVARGTSKRKAEDAARKALANELPGLPLAGGGSLADKLADKSTGPALAARIDRALANAISLAAEPETDGAWTVTLAVPTEAIRQALLGGPRTIDAAKPPPAAPAALIIEGATAPPAIGYTVGGIAGATIFVTAVPAWAKSAPRVRASGVRGAAIDAPVAGASEATLFVIVAN